MSETLVLDPAEEATGRFELDITDWVGPAGPDYGEAAYEAYRAKSQLGEQIIDVDLPNRIIAVPLLLRDIPGITFEEARAAVQAKVGLFQERGGWLKRTTAIGPLYAVVQAASLKLGGSTAQALWGIDADAVLTLETLSEWYGEEIQLDDIVETTNGEIAAVLKQGGVPAIIKGDRPARCRIVVDEDQGQSQLGLIAALDYHSAEPTAQVAYEAEQLTPLDLAAVATLLVGTGSVSGGSASNVVQHTNLSTAWTPVLSTDMRPAVRSVGAAASGTGNVTPGAPPGSVANDIWLLYVETANEAVGVPTGWAHVEGSGVGVTTGGVTRLTVLWKRVADGETAPTITDPGDHCVARIVAVSGCIETGNPWDVTGSGTEAVVDTSVSILGATTTVDGCLVLAAVATGADVGSVGQASAFANADLQELTERLDNWVADGSGGGFAMASGRKVSAGAYAATTCTLATAAEKAMLSIALKPKPAEENMLTHTGTRRLWARVHSTDGDAVQLRLVYDVGDLTLPVENRAKVIPIAGNLWLADLGEVRLDEVPVGDHRWRGVIQAKGAAGGEDISIDKLWTLPVNESYALLRAQLAPEAGLAPFAARDEFPHSAGNLTGKTASIGGPWAGAGDADDFTINTTDKAARRTAVSDAGTTPFLPGGRLATLNVNLAAVAVQVDVRLSDASKLAIFNSQFGLIARYAAADSFAALTFDATGLWAWANQPGGESILNGNPVTGAGADRLPFEIASNAWYTMRFVIDADGRYWGWMAPTGAVLGQPIVVGHGAAFETDEPLAVGDVGLVDWYFNSPALTRDYRNFAAWVPNLDAILHPNKSAELRSDGTFRETADGNGWGPTQPPIGDLLRLPPSGLEQRPVELFVKATRGDADRLPDHGIDDISAQLFYTPSWLFVPGA